jgi:hypothetical protein
VNLSNLDLSARKYPADYLELRRLTLATEDEYTKQSLI